MSVCIFCPCKKWGDLSFRCRRWITERTKRENVDDKRTQSAPAEHGLCPLSELEDNRCDSLLWLRRTPTGMSHNYVHTPPSSRACLRSVSAPLGRHRGPGGPARVARRLPAGYLLHTRRCPRVSAPFSAGPSLSSRTVAAGPASTPASPFLLSVGSSVLVFWTPGSRH